MTHSSVGWQQDIPSHFSFLDIAMTYLKETPVDFTIDF